MNFEKFKAQYEYIPVIEHPNRVTDNPLVSVCVQTYNQVNYIKECLNGILMQKTDFPIEILLGEDASSDGTREICLEYQEKYPDKIRLFLHHRENNIKINGGFTGRFNFLYNLYSATGKYIALCEGDDYWTDPLKIQKQVDFLNRNDEVGIVHTKYEILHEIQNKFVVHERKIWNPDFSDFRNYLFTGDMRTLTVMFRSKYLKYVEALMEDGIMVKSLYGDRSVFLTIASKSKIGYINEITGVYRVFDGVSATRYPSLKDKYISSIKHCDSLTSLCTCLQIKDEEYKKVIEKKRKKLRWKLILLNIPLLRAIYNILYRMAVNGRSKSY